MITVNKTCDCCGEKLQNPYLTMVVGYDEKKVSIYCIDCARLLIEEHSKAVEELKDRFDYD